MYVHSTTTVTSVSIFDVEVGSFDIFNIEDVESSYRMLQSSAGSSMMKNTRMNESELLSSARDHWPLHWRWGRFCYSSSGAAGPGNESIAVILV